MTTLDKHPPLDPKRHSTNKRVKPLGENIFGTPVLTAEGSKRVRPGDDNTTSAKFLGAGESLYQKTARLEEEARAKRLEEAFKKESFLSEAHRKLLDKGWRTGNEQQTLSILRKKQGNLT